jgi:hypothetical protein
MARESLEPGSKQGAGNVFGHPWRWKVLPSGRKWRKKHALGRPPGGGEAEPWGAGVQADRQSGSVLHAAGPSP